MHPKAGQNAKPDALRAIKMLGESVFALYGVTRLDDLVGKMIRSAYVDLPDVCSGANFLPAAFASPAGVVAHARRHEKAKSVATRAKGRKVAGRPERTSR